MEIFILKKFLLLSSLAVSLTLFAEEIQCPKDSLLSDIVLSYSKERIQVCQIKVDGKYLKNGPEIIYNADGTIKSKKYFKQDVETVNTESTMTFSDPGLLKIEKTKNCPAEGILVENHCVPKSGTVWKGRYSCPQFQGETELVFTMGTGEDKAIFEFYAKNGHGKYTMKGTYTPEKNLLEFEPVEWILKPKNYSMIGMSGTVSFEEHTYKGRMSGCALFDLKAQ